MVMVMTLTEIARLLQGKLIGDKNVTIRGLNGLKEAQKGELSFLSNPKYAPLLNSTQASAIIVSQGFPVPNKTVIEVKNPSLAFAQVAQRFYKDDAHPLKGTHKTAIVAKDAKIGKNVVLGPYAVIESKAQIGDNTVIHAGCFVGYKAVIGKGCLFYPHVTIREKLKIGDRVTIHSGTVIGSDGFGYGQEDGVHVKIPQLGTVVIEDDVEIGANVTVDRARFDKTFIGQGTKIDNLVQVGHNVYIGEKCIIISQVGISGSVKIEKGSILAGQAGIAGHLTIGEGSIVAAQAGVTKSLPAKSFVSGYPATPHEEAKKVNACVQRLPVYVEKIRALEKRIEELEKKVKK